MIRSLLALSCLAPSLAAAMTFDVAVHVGGGGYLDDGLPYGPGVAAELGLGLTVLPMLSVGADVSVGGLPIERDPGFQVDDPSATLTLFAARVSGRVLALDPVELWVTGHVGGFRHAIVGRDSVSGEVERTVSGVNYGAAVDGWWRVSDLVSIGARLRLSWLDPGKICGSAEQSRRCRDVTALEDQTTTHLGGLAGLRLSF